MGLFSKLFGKGNKEEKKQPEKEPVFYAQPDEKIKEATLAAQKSFKYFWRELYWEYRRIVPAHDFAMIKIPFEQKLEGYEEPSVEHMWINNINFDGELITGELVNAPNYLTNVSKGDKVAKKVNEIGDWMISIVGKVHGGFTIQAMRSGMSDEERQTHDTAWGLDFGDYNEVLLVYKQKENPENLIEHPMSKNMAEQFREYYTNNPNELAQADENGRTVLHTETIAGNQTSVEILLELGADKTKKTNAGKLPIDYAKAMNWEHLMEVLG